jgi:hypothetical protein
MMHEITDSQGNTHYLTDYAVLALQLAKTAREAEAAFERHACDVPRQCRASVWQEVDTITIPK